MSTQLLSRPMQIGLLVLLVGAFYYWRTAAPGPLDLSDAERLAEASLRVEAVNAERVGAIAPDGEEARLPIDQIENLRALACPKVASRSGSLPGRYGALDRTYGSAAYECLLQADGPADISFHLAIYVYRSDDPSMPADSDGFATQLLMPRHVLEVMREQGQTVQAYSSEEQAALWATLAEHDVYVPADKTQKSPLQKAMDAHKKRITTD